jgi:hypothetical protein
MLSLAVVAMCAAQAGTPMDLRVPETRYTLTPQSATTDVEPADPAAATVPASTKPPPRDRVALMEANLRYRYMSVPDSVMDIWFFDSDDEGANDFDRPAVRMYAVGVEYVLKPRPSNWIFYYEYIGSLMEEGYWDDVEEPPEHDDGDWVNPERLGVHVLGVNYAHEIEVTPSDRDVWLSMLFGAGLGVGVVVGELEQWHPGGNEGIDNQCRRQSPSYDRKDASPDDGAKRIPGLIPVLDLSGSFRLNFADRANVRLDFGLHDMFYIGTAAGGVF